MRRDHKRAHGIKPPTAGVSLVGSLSRLRWACQKGKLMRKCAECSTEFEWHGGQGRAPMTCSPDCQRKRKTRKSEESRQRAAKRGCPPDKHGTSTGYSHFKCDCAKCTQWAREYKQHRRQVQRSITEHLRMEGVSHGNGKGP